FPLAAIRKKVLRISALSRGGDMLATRCAGPLDGDLASVGPVASVSLPRALRGRRTIDLSATRHFAAHGFVGTLHSTPKLRLGRHRTLKNTGGGSLPPGAKFQRIRLVNERLSSGGFAGVLRARIAGPTDPSMCGPLDACGLTGDLVINPFARRTSGYLSAIG